MADTVFCCVFVGYYLGYALGIILNFGGVIS